MTLLCCTLTNHLLLKICPKLQFPSARGKTCVKRKYLNFNLCPSQECVNQSFAVKNSRVCTALQSWKSSILSVFLSLEVDKFWWFMYHFYAVVTGQYESKAKSLLEVLQTTWLNHSGCWNLLHQHGHVELSSALWLSSTDRVLNLNMTITLLLFWSTSCQIRGKHLPTYAGLKCGSRLQHLYNL